jgi:CRP-like cAMP-binding protein
MRGDGFGEIALLRAIPRTATCTALTDGTLYGLRRDHFLGAVTGHPQAAEVVEELASSRLRSDRPVS